MTKALYSLSVLALLGAAPAHAWTTGDSLEPALRDAMSLLARCDYNKDKPSEASLFLGTYNGETKGSLVLVQNGDAHRFYVSGKIQRDGEITSAEVGFPIRILVRIEGADGTVTLSDGYGEPAVVKAGCRYY